jgi:uncharacterized membrane-anchored protein YhcB (DUF1043 family)
MSFQELLIEEYAALVKEQLKRIKALEEELQDAKNSLQKYKDLLASNCINVGT